MNRYTASLTFHPAVILLYFLIVISFVMFLFHPVFLCIALLGALSYFFLLKKKGFHLFSIKKLLPMFLFLSLLNPLFNHQGTTILFSITPTFVITLESFVYGLFVGILFFCIFIWFACCNVLLSSDKIIFLFSKFAPNLSLTFCVSLRLLAKYQTRLKEIRSAGIHSFGSDSFSSRLQRFKKTALSFFSITSWALESSIITSDSMKARGFGLKGRTSLSLFRFTVRDAVSLLLLCILFFFILLAPIKQETVVSFYPFFSLSPPSGLTKLSYCSYTTLCFLPVILELWEDTKWRRLQSKI